MSRSTITTRVEKQWEDSDLVNTKNNSWSAQMCDPTYTGLAKSSYRVYS